MEIGSEFWLENIANKNQIKEKKLNEIYFLSGRTAINYAIDILEKNKKIEVVYFPSYCCNSMLQPFLEKNIKIEFYTVRFKDGDIVYDIDYNKECDVFFAMNYFGFSKYNMDYYIKKFKERNIYIIEDSTHSWLSKRKYNNKSDLVIASLRKWFPIISGAILINPMNHLNINRKVNNLKFNEKYTKLREEAMLEKSKYINNYDKIENRKKEFLKKFSASNDLLQENYKNYKIDEKSYDFLNNIDLEKIIKKRKDNTIEIYNYLKTQEKIGYLKHINLEEDCPIFVPIFLEQHKRDKLKEYLINNKIYCPTHWNIPECIETTNEKEIYNKEISLICDQRYEKEQIREYITLIKNKEL